MFNIDDEAVADFKLAKLIRDNLLSEMMQLAIDENFDPSIVAMAVFSAGCILLKSVFGENIFNILLSDAKINTPELKTLFVDKSKMN